VQPVAVPPLAKSAASTPVTGSEKTRSKTIGSALVTRSVAEIPVSDAACIANVVTVGRIVSTTIVSEIVTVEVLPAASRSWT
jgi:hypothetical protein